MKNSIFALFLFCFMSSGLLAQTQAPAAPQAEKPVSRQVDDAKANTPLSQKARIAPSKVANNTPLRVPGKANTYSRLPNMPQFPGCESLKGNQRMTCANKSMLKHIYQHPNFAAQPARNLIGTCVYKFIVDTDGMVSDVRIMRALSDDPAFINETKAIFEEMPKWTPGMLDGKAVNVEMSVPVSFK